MRELIRSFYKKYRRFKIELDDLRQEAELLQHQGKDIAKGLEDYCRHWREDRCSYAVPLQDYSKVSPVAEIIEWDENSKFILTQIRKLLTDQEWDVWSSVVLLAMKQCYVADELSLSQGEVSKTLAQAQEKIKEMDKVGRVVEKFMEDNYECH